MEEQYLEEEIEVIEYSYNNISDVIAMLKNLSSERYGMLISQCQGLLNDIDYILADKEEELNSYSQQELIESRLERNKRESEAKENLNF